MACLESSTQGQVGSHVSIPVIDIGPFVDVEASLGRGPLPEAAEAVVRDWRKAFGDLGFAQIVGHGVADEVIDAAHSSGQRFFRQSAADKEECNLGLGYGAGGYTSQGVERVCATVSNPDGSGLTDMGRPPDLVESMVVRGLPDDKFPEGVPGFREASLVYFDEMTRLLRVMMRLTALSLDEDPHFFDRFFFDPNSEGVKCIGECALRYAYYPPVGGEVAERQLRYGEHTDYTGFTILWQDHNTSGRQTAAEGLHVPPPSLQVRLSDGQWVDCPPVPGAFTINAGDLIQVWTNDVLRSNTHRVQNPPSGDWSDRLSLVFFTGPSADTLVQCMPSCCGAQPPRYEPITSGEHLAQKLRASNS